MNGKKLITIVGSVLVGFGVLALTLRYLASTPPKIEPSVEAVFVSTPEKQTAVLRPGGVISQKGSLQFGEFALLQLTSDDAALEFKDAEFDENTNVIARASGLVQSGNVLAVNLLFGNELALADERVAAVSRGGSFVFEKTEESTRVRVLSGSVGITILWGAEPIFETALIAGKETTLTADALANIAAAVDSLQRVAAWQTTVGTFESRFEGESRLLSKILERLPSRQRSLARNIYRQLKERLIFLPTAREDFYEEELAAQLAKAAAGDPQAVSDYLATASSLKRAKLQEAVMRAIPLARLLVVESLPPGSKQKIGRLAELSTPLAEFAQIADLPESVRINRDLLLLADNPESTKYAKTLLDRTKAVTDSAQNENATFLLELLAKNEGLASEEWLAAYAQLNRARITTDNDLAFAISDQLNLADFLVRDGKGELAGKALRELVGLLSQASERLPTESLEQVAALGNDIKNRILFLANIRNPEDFNEEAYREWLEGQEAAAAESAASESEITEKAGSGRVARPQSELSKFLELLDLPEEMGASEPTEGEETGEVEAGENCGTSESFLTSDMEVESDVALACLGRKLLDDCRPAEAILKTIGGGAVEMKIEGGSSEECQIYLKFGETSQIKNEGQKKYAGKFLRCPVDLEALKVETPSATKPAVLARGVIVYIFADLGSTSLKAKKCTGSILEDLPTAEELEDEGALLPPPPVDEVNETIPAGA